MSDDRPTNPRFPADIPVEVFSGPIGGVRVGDGVLLDLSLSGCLLRVRGLLKPGSTYRVRVVWKGTPLDLPGRVARDMGPAGADPAARHYGLAFNLTGGQEKELRRLIDDVRRIERPEDKGYLRNYWG